MPRRMARKLSIASVWAATRNRMKANSISPDPIAHTMTGTSRMRAIVMRLGRFKASGPRLWRPDIATLHRLAKLRRRSHCAACDSAVQAGHAGQARMDGAFLSARPRHLLHLSPRAGRGRIPTEAKRSDGSRVRGRLGRPE